MTIDYGSDFNAPDDIDPNFALVSGPLAIAQALVRRYETPRGSLWYDPEYGMDLRGMLSNSIGPGDLFVIQTACCAQATQDERVDGAVATATLNALTRTLTISVSITSNIGPFQFVLTADDAAVTLVGLITNANP